MKDMLKIGFMGSGVFAAECLRLLCEKIRPEWVITNTPKPAGRGLAPHATPVYEAASELGLVCHTTEKISQDAGLLEWMKDNIPDLILVIDFGHILKEPLLSMARLQCINIHPSMLPAYRGAAPIQRAIMDGLAQTGVTLFKLDKGMDSGPVLSQVSVEIEKSDDTASLLLKCAKAGTEELLHYICDIGSDEWVFTEQPEEGASLAPKIGKDEGKIDWNESSQRLYNMVRALSVSPGTYCTVKLKRLRIYEAQPSDESGKAGTVVALSDGMPVIACGSGALKLISVQPEGRKILNAAEWFRGSRLKIGDSL